MGLVLEKSERLDSCCTACLWPIEGYEAFSPSRFLERERFWWPSMVDAHALRISVG